MIQCVRSVGSRVRCSGLTVLPSRVISMTGGNPLRETFTLSLSLPLGRNWTHSICLNACSEERKWWKVKSGLLCLPSADQISTRRWMFDEVVFLLHPSLLTEVTNQDSKQWRTTELLVIQETWAAENLLTQEHCHSGVTAHSCLVSKLNSSWGIVLYWCLSPDIHWPLLMADSYLCLPSECCCTGSPVHPDIPVMVQHLDQPHRLHPAETLDLSSQRQTTSASVTSPEELQGNFIDKINTITQLHSKYSKVMMRLN